MRPDTLVIIAITPRYFGIHYWKAFECYQ